MLLSSQHSVVRPVCYIVITAVASTLWSPFSSIKNTHESNEHQLWPFFLRVQHCRIASAGSYCRVQMNESKVYLFLFDEKWIKKKTTNGWIQDKGGGACDICSIFTNKRAQLNWVFFFCLRSNSRCPLNSIFDYAVGDPFPFYYYCQRASFYIMWTHV